MATLLEDLSVYLPSIGSLSLTFGTNLFAGLIPDGTDSNGHAIPDVLTSLLEYPGEEPIDTMGERSDLPGAPQISRPRFQVVVRGAEDDYLGPRAAIDGVTYALRKVVNTVLNGTLYYRIQSVQDPFLLQRDERRRAYMACNFMVMRHPVS